VVTKWDLAEGRKNRKGQIVSTRDYLTHIQHELPGLAHAPIVFSAAVDRTGIEQVVEVAFELYEQSRQRVGTGELNSIIRRILEERGPSSKLGKRAKILFVSQVATSPPTIVMIVNHPELFGPDYQRYLMNRLREHTPFKEVAIRLIIRERKRADLNDLLSGEHAKRRRLEDEADGEVFLEDEGDEAPPAPARRSPGRRG